VSNWWDSLGGWNQFWFIIGVLMVLAALRQGALSFIRDAGRAWRGETRSRGAFVSARPVGLGRCSHEP
jgi:hypothetical protein